MSEHTKEPWKVVRCIQNEYRSVAFSTKRDELYTTSPLLPEDARRIVACVNALAGVDDPKSIAKVLRDLLDDFIRAIPSHEAIDCKKYHGYQPALLLAAKLAAAIEGKGT